MNTKYKEITFRTSSLEEMKDKFLAERVLRSWNEEFVDEDTSEVVEIQRNEILFERGTLLDNETLSQLNFYFQTGDVKDVLVSNQQRTGKSVGDIFNVYSVIVKNGNKKKTYYLYAKSVEQSILIITDFLEQKLTGNFSFVSVKEISFCNLIPKNNSENENTDFYKVELEILREDSESFAQMYILKSKDAEEAKNTIENYIVAQSTGKENKQDFTTTILSAKTISCNDIVEYDFSKEYF